MVHAFRVYRRRKNRGICKGRAAFRLAVLHVWNRIACGPSSPVLSCRHRPRIPSSPAGTCRLQQAQAGTLPGRNNLLLQSSVRKRLPIRYRRTQGLTLIGSSRDVPPFLGRDASWTNLNGFSSKTLQAHAPHFCSPWLPELCYFAPLNLQFEFFKTNGF